jgi:hypothetical protein
MLIPGNMGERRISPTATAEVRCAAPAFVFSQMLVNSTGASDIDLDQNGIKH